MIRPVALGLAVAALTGALPAAADQARLLPFWGRPFPSGYVREEESPCMVPRRVETRRGSRTVLVDRCHSVLHARG